MIEQDTEVNRELLSKSLCRNSIGGIYKGYLSEYRVARDFMVALYAG